MTEPKRPVRTGSETPRAAARRTRTSTSKDGGGSGQRVANRFVAVSSAVVLGIYAAGYFRTKAASDRSMLEAAQRRPAQPISAASAGQSFPPRSMDAGAPEAIAASVRVAAATPGAPPAAAPATVRGSRDVQPAAGIGTAPAAAAKIPSTSSAAGTPVQPVAAAAASTSEASNSTADRPSVEVAAPVAPAPAVAVVASPEPAVPGKPAYKDGSYAGWGSSRHGDIEATVTIISGRIGSAVISQCLTRYPCSWITPLPPQVAVRQSAEVDYVSGATESTNAFYYAVLQALSKAK